MSEKLKNAERWRSYHWPRRIAVRMKGILLSLFLVLFYVHSTQGSWNSELFHRYFIKREWIEYCKQETPNCNECLAKSGCSWCGKDGIFECSPEQNCPQQEIQDTCTQPQNDFPKTYTRENAPSFLDISVDFNPRDVVFGVNSCSARKNCSDCTNEGSCAWCEKTRTCLPHYNASTTKEACGSDLWYKDQCIYSCKYLSYYSHFVMLLKTVLTFHETIVVRQIFLMIPNNIYFEINCYLTISFLISYQLILRRTQLKFKTISFCLS